MPNTEPGFRRRLWEALNPSQEWSEGVDDSEDHLVGVVVEKMSNLKWVYDQKAEVDERVRKLENGLTNIKVALWEHDDAPERPMGVRSHHITSEIRRLQAASLGTKKKAAKKWAGELLKALNHAGELEEEVQTIEVDLRKLSEELGVLKVPDNRGEQWVRRELLTNLGMWMRGLLSRIEYAETGQQLWNEMFAHLRDVAANYAPAVAHCQPAEHIFELCRNPKRFRLEVERRVHRPSEAIQIQTSLKEEKKDGEAG